MPFRLRTVALLSIALLSATSAFSRGPVNRTILIRIDNVKPDALQKTGILNYDEYDYRSIISVVRDTALVIVTPVERAILTERGYTSTVIMEDTSELTLIRRAMYGPTMKLEKPYHSYQEIGQRLLELEKTYPTLVKVSTIGATTQKKQPIYAATLGKYARKANDAKDDSDRPSILIDGCHHSNEVLGAEISLAAAEMLATQYGADPEVTRWLDNLRIVIVPVVNPDGHDVVTSGQDPRWRKNLRAPEGDAPALYPFGVDLNRNYDFNWGGGGAGEPSSGRYRGTFPFSEAEPRAIAALAKNERFLLSISYHSQGEVIYYPWNWKGLASPDDALILPMAHSLAGSIPNMRGDSSYKAEPGAALVGQSYPWLYGTLGTFDFIVETGYGAAIFPPYEVPGIVNANLNGVRTMLRRAEGPGVAFHVSDASTGAPLEATVWLPKFETEAVNRRTTNPATGTLYRFLTPYTHQVIVSKPGYETMVLPSVNPPDAGWQRIEVKLKRSPK